MPATPTTPRAVLLDVDGTLVTDLARSQQAFREAFGAHVLPQLR